MTLTYLQSASVIIEDNGTKILCDPWLIDGVQYGSWSHYPPFEFHPGSNYIKDSTQGKPSHRARIEIDLIIAKKGIKNYYDVCKSFALVGVGRDITIILESSK